MTRRICYITGTRADFGLMQGALKAIQLAEPLELVIIATGTHLAEQYGYTIRDIEKAALPVQVCIALDLEPRTGATTAANIGKMLIAFVDALTGIRPDLLLLLGDRGEMLAGAIAAVHLNIPVVHVHGGERSGTVDEPVRHAISKLSHYHLVATVDARERLIRMGELAKTISVVGAPGLDGLEGLASIGREALLENTGLDAKRPVALMVYHPVFHESATAGTDSACILDALCQQGIQVIALKPNSDAGSDQIVSVLEARANDPGVSIATHWRRDRFVSWMAAADLMIGNSSAGIIEAASFGTPVINIGSRQNLRERNANVVDVPINGKLIETAIANALDGGRYERRNIYGDGKTAGRIVAFLRDVSLDKTVLEKANAY